MQAILVDLLKSLISIGSFGVRLEPPSLKVILLEGLCSFSPGSEVLVLLRIEGRDGGLVLEEIRVALLEYFLLGVRLLHLRWLGPLLAVGQ